MGLWWKLPCFLAASPLPVWDRKLKETLISPHVLRNSILCLAAHHDWGSRGRSSSSNRSSHIITLHAIVRWDSAFCSFSFYIHKPHSSHYPSIHLSIFPGSIHPASIHCQSIAALESLGRVRPNPLKQWWFSSWLEQNLTAPSTMVNVSQTGESFPEFTEFMVGISSFHEFTFDCSSTSTSMYLTFSPRAFITHTLDR